MINVAVRIKLACARIKKNKSAELIQAYGKEVSLDEVNTLSMYVKKPRIHLLHGQSCLSTAINTCRFHDKFRK